MLLLKSYVFYILIFSSSYLVGAAIISYFKDEKIIKNKLYFSPIIGLLFFIIFSYFLGFFIGFSENIPLFSFLIIVFTSSLIILKRFGFKSLIPFSLRTFVFVLLGSLSVFGPIILYSGFNPFNDSFTYLVHAQWLQENSFNQITSGSGFFQLKHRFIYIKKLVTGWEHLFC